VNSVKRLTQSLAAIGDCPGLDDEERLQRRFLIVTAVAMGFGGVVWGSLALFLGLPLQSTIPYGYTAITAANLVYLWRTKDFAVVRAVQVLISLVLPFALQWSLGGFVSSGAMMTWALLALTASQSFGNLRVSLVWLGFFLALVVCSVIVDPYLPVPEVMNDRTLTRIAFAINLSTVAMTVYGLTSYFLLLRHNSAIELAATNRELVASRQALVQSEKMASLGRLSAGIAHELNNPATVAQRGASRLGPAMEELMRVSYRLGDSVRNQAQQARIEELDAMARARAGSPIEVDALERADREDDIGVWIGRHAADDLAPHVAGIVDLGLQSSDLDDLIEVFDAALLSIVLRRAALLLAVISLLGEISRGSNRVAGIVKALKSYSYLDRGELQLVSVNDGLDDTLLMLGSVLKQGITVQRDYDASLPSITASGGELNQVWTNLIDNAADAMEGSGALSIRTRREGDEIVVQVIDSGRGIPDELREQVFDPFVTSKSVGDGTGLGLNITHNIVVQKHKGTITFASKPGRTCFEVRLPSHAADSRDAKDRVAVPGGRA